MSNMKVNKLLVDGFSTYQLVDFEQNKKLPPIEEDHILYEIENGLFDLRLPLALQLPKLVSATHGKYFIPLTLVNYCYFIDLLFDSIKAHNYIDSKLLDNSLTLKIIFIKLLYKDPQFIQTANHHLRQLLDQMFSHMVGWSQSLGGSGSGLLEHWKHIIKLLEHLDGTEIDMPNKVLKRLEGFQKLIDELTAIEEKVTDHEHRHLNDREPHNRVDEFLDKELNNKRLPAPIANFLTVEWRKSLIHVAEQEDSESSKWIQATEFTQDLIKNYDVDGDGANILIISTMRPKLEKYLSHTAEDNKQLFEEIDSINDNLLNNVEMQGVTVRPLLEKNRLKHLNFSASIIKIVSNLKIGQWIYFTDGEMAKSRLKISNKITNTQEFLFVNQTCSRIFIKSFQGLAYLLMSKKAVLLEPKNTFNKCFVDALDTYFKHYKEVHKVQEAQKEEAENKKQHSLEKIKHEADKLRIQKEEMEQKLREEADKLRQANLELEKKIKQELDEKHAKETALIRKEQEKEKAEIERKYLEEVAILKQRKDDAEQMGQEELNALKLEKERLQEKLQEKSSENRRYEAAQQVKSLSIGSWMSLPDSKGENVTCKIAIIYASSGKYVFVDNNGIRVAEFVAEEIVGLLLTGAASILKQESSFESSMEKIIKSLKD